MAGTGTEGMWAAPNTVPQILSGHCCSCPLATHLSSSAAVFHELMGGGLPMDADNREALTGLLGRNAAGNGLRGVGGSGLMAKETLSLCP